MKPEEIELFRVLVKYPTLIQENPELFALSIRKIDSFREGLFTALQPVFELIVAVMKPFVELFNEELEEKKNGNESHNH